MPFAQSKWLKAPISIRIAFLFCVTFAIGLTASFLVTYFQLSYSLERASKEVISAKFRETSAILATEGVHGLRQFLSSEKNRILNASYMIRVMNDFGEILYTKASVQEKTFDFESAFRKEVQPEKILGWHALSAINDEDRFDILTEKVGPSVYFQVGRSSEDREEILGNILGIFVIVGALFIFLSCWLGLWYARKSLAPIRGLLSTILGIEKGDLSQRVTLNKSQDELHDLGETFNRMIARIEKLIQIMRESLDNVAHDIRTPLTRIRAVAEDALLSGKQDDLKEALEDCAESAADISGLVDQLLSISEAEAGTLTLRRETCDLKMLLDDVVEIYEFVAQEKGIKVKVSPIQVGLVWDLDRKRIKQVIGNLLDNAIKFSPNNTSILLSAITFQSKIIISVRDHGYGISESDLTRIWDRLFRGDKSRSTKGLGLGLSIVRSIVTAHGGQVEARAETGGGMVFSISLPKVEIKKDFQNRNVPAMHT